MLLQNFQFWESLQKEQNKAYNNARKPLRRHQKTQLFILAIIVFVSETACCSVTSNMFLFKKQITLIPLFHSFRRQPGVSQLIKDVRKEGESFYFNEKRHQEERLLKAARNTLFQLVLGCESYAITNQNLLNCIEKGNCLSCKTIAIL